MSGRVILAANDDWDGVPGVLTHVPGAVHADGAMYVVAGGAAIPQVRETRGYVYTACKYAIGNLDRGWAGGMNDHGVAVAGTGVDAYRPVSWKQEGYLLEPDDIPLLILQRGTGARQAVRHIGDLINAYGLRPSAMEGSVGTSAATFSIVDQREGWVLEVYPGRCWLAVRVPDDCVSVRVNAFGTHDADLADPEKTMYSPGLAAYARERGLWDGDEKHFDFSSAFGAETSLTEWGPEKDPMNRRRRWRAMVLADGLEEQEETLRYLARPIQRSIAVDDMMRILSDVYEGTPYDLKKVPEAGRWHDPFADDLPEYAICRKGTVASLITEYIGEDQTDARTAGSHFAGKRGGSGDREPLLWIALGTPRLVPYIPVWVKIEKLPACCEETEPEKTVFPEKTVAFQGQNSIVHVPSLFWEMKKLCMLVQRRYDQNEEVTVRAKEAYQREMKLLLREEVRRKYTDAPGKEESVQGKQTGNSLLRERTEQTAAHIQEALEVCRKTRAALLKRY